MGRAYAVRRITVVGVVMTALIAIAVPAAQADVDADIDFGVANALEPCVRSAVHISAPQPVPASSVAALTTLYCDALTPGMNVDLTPLSQASALTDLRVRQDGAQRPTLIMLSAGMPALSGLEVSGYTVAGGTTAAAPRLESLTLTHSGLASLGAVTASSAIVAISINSGTEVADWSELGGYSDLESLTVSDLPTFDLGVLPVTPAIRVIDIYRTHVSGWEAVSALTQLDRLRVSYGDLTSVSGPAHAASVRYLNVSGNAITDTTGLSALTRLVTLDLTDNRISDPRPVIGLPSSPTVLLSANSILDARNLTTEHGSISVYDQRGDTLFAPACAPIEVPLITPVSGASVEYFLKASGYESGTTLPQPLGTVDGSTMTVTETTGLHSVSVQWSMTGSPSTSGSFTVHLLRCFDPAAAVEISGQARMGAPLTAVVTGVPSTAAVAYVWTRDGQPIADATSPTYVVTQADAGHALSATATLTATAYAARTLVAAPVDVTLALSHAAPTVSGTPTVGRTLSATPPTFPAGTAVAFRWLRDGVSISGATASTYRVATADIGHTLTVRTTATLAGYPAQTSLSSGFSALGVLGSVATAGRISTGSTSATVNVGAVLTTKAPTFKVGAPSSTSRQWLRNGVPITGATGSTYTVTKADAGTKITVTFTSRKSHYVSTVSTAPDVITVRRLFSTTPAPVITGNTAAGNTLTASAGTWTPTATLSYQWYRNGKAISGATKSTYRISRSHGGSAIKVKVTATRSGYTTVSRTTASVTLRKNLTSAPTPTLSGTAKVGSTLKVTTGTWRPGTVSKKIQWYVNGIAVPGATGTSYVVRPRDAYGSIAVTVSGSKSGYATVTRTSSTKTATGIHYTSCAAMRRHYPDGVAHDAGVVDLANGKSGGAIDRAPFVSARLYALNTEWDIDDDGWACP